ncbi:hypothetical protein C2G38_2030477 [Gigaspora rosea]|uniref:Serine-threonine/tyrosine-protein kinase catalytic domain-containing protein n=1 Tax=Gigaspora rosea TaxID=44941 RepID=A0A397VVZ1_9GLOM|nr:hypothetical protein C2G38_2030477 [Gigaspora rosea]
MVMWVIAHGRQPYDGQNFDSSLAVNIFLGLRPEFNKEYVPKCYIELARRCMDLDPEKRPWACEVVKEIDKWRKCEVIMNQFEDVDKFIPITQKISMIIRNVIWIADQRIPTNSYNLNLNKPGITIKNNGSSMEGRNNM